MRAQIFRRQNFEDSYSHKRQSDKLFSFSIRIKVNANLDEIEVGLFHIIYPQPPDCSPQRVVRIYSGGYVY